MNTDLTTSSGVRPPRRTLTPDPVLDPSSGKYIRVCVEDWCVDKMDRCLNPKQQATLAVLIAAHHELAELVAQIDGADHKRLLFRGHYFSFGREHATGDAIIFEISEGDNRPGKGHLGPLGKAATHGAVSGLVRELIHRLIQIFHLTYRDAVVAQAAPTRSIVCWGALENGKTTFVNALLDRPLHNIIGRCEVTGTSDPGTAGAAYGFTRHGVALGLPGLAVFAYVLHLHLLAERWAQVLDRRADGDARVYTFDRALTTNSGKPADAGGGVAIANALAAWMASAQLADGTSDSPTGKHVSGADALLASLVTWAAAGTELVETGTSLRRWGGCERTATALAATSLSALRTGAATAVSATKTTTIEPQQTGNTSTGLGLASVTVPARPRCVSAIESAASVVAGGWTATRPGDFGIHLTGTEAHDLTGEADLRGLILEIRVASRLGQTPRSPLNDTPANIRSERHMTESDKDRDALLRRAMADLSAHAAGVKTLRTFRAPEVPEIDVPALRERLHDSVDQFAARLGVTRDLVIAWECEEEDLAPDLCRLLSLLDAFPEEVTCELAKLRSTGNA